MTVARPLENLNGAMLLAALAAASAQVVSAVTPEAGLPLVLGVIFLFALFVNTLAAHPDRTRALRALFVAFFTAFTVKFILLDALYAPGKSLGGRLLTGLLEGVTLGSLDHVLWAPGTGYVVFLALVIYFVALTLMPRVPEQLPSALTTGVGFHPVIAQIPPCRAGLIRRSPGVSPREMPVQGCFRWHSFRYSTK